MTDEQRKTYLDAIAAGMSEIRLLVDYYDGPITGDAVGAIWDWDDAQILKADAAMTEFCKLCAFEEGASFDAQRVAIEQLRAVADDDPLGLNREAAQ